MDRSTRTRTSTTHKKQQARQRAQRRRKLERCRTLIGDYFLKQAIWSPQIREDLLQWIATLPDQEQELFEAVTWLHDPVEEHQNEDEPPLSFCPLPTADRPGSDPKSAT